MFGLGMPELLIILFIVILVFGAGRLPEIGGAVGKAIRGFKRSVRDIEDPIATAAKGGAEKPK
jgi:sec-independent protein translocase protein TatA